MKQFTSVEDVGDPSSLITQGLKIKSNPCLPEVGKGKTLGLIFFNPSLRTRLSTQKAALNLGMNIISMDIGKDGWKIEFNDGAVMNGDTQEHIKDAVAVISSYVDILAVRTFASLTNREEDYQEKILTQFVLHSSVPIISMESATLHPLQSLADMMTIKEYFATEKPKIAVTWAPHPKVLPQAVANSFLQWGTAINLDITIAQPKGYELSDEFTKKVKVTHDQSEALSNADIVYTKNWSSYSHYGQSPEVNEDWTVTAKKMALTNKGKFMHCLPVRRNVVASDSVIDNSIVRQQAKNREYSAQAVLKQIIENL